MAEMLIDFANYYLLLASLKTSLVYHYNLLVNICSFNFVDLSFVHVLLPSAGHPACLDLTKAMVSIIKNYPWQCMECKTCVQCMDPYDEVGVLLYALASQGRSSTIR